MKTANDHEAMFWQMLEKNRLVDLSQFHKPDFFEEVPLYSRQADVSFLADYSADQASVVLLRFALKFLNAVVSYEEHDTPFFAAITVADFSPGDPIVPNLFVWSQPTIELYEKLNLNETSTPWGRKIKRYVSQAHLRDPYEVFEDTATVPDFPRAFVAPALPAYHAFVPIYMFCRTRKSAAQPAIRRKQANGRASDER